MAFSWVPGSAPDQVAFVSAIEPDEILYDFDGPVLFTSKSRFFPILCYKTDEDSSLTQYIIVPTNKDIVARLKEGRIALRSAITQAWGWIAEAENQFQIRRTWSIGTDSLPDAVLPEPGYGIYPAHGIVNERAAYAANPFLSIRFSGADVVAGQLPFGVFKTLVDEVATTLWAIFAPAVHAAGKKLSEQTVRRAVRIPTYEPAFASLLISIEQPTVDLSVFRGDKPEINEVEAAKNIARAYEEFFDSAKIMANAAARGEMTVSLVGDNIEATEALVPLIPTRRSFFDRVEIRSRNRKDDIVINVATADQIRDAYTNSLAGKRTIIGEVVEINSPSGSFIVRSASFRNTTCIAWSDPIRGAISRLHNGMHVSVSGSFEKRKRRDRLWIDRITVGRRTTVAN
jgi:hypothetical protein